MQNAPKFTSDGFHIVSLKSWPLFFASFCYIPTVHILQRYHLENFPPAETAGLSKEIYEHFIQDSQSSNPDDDAWLQSFLGSNKYEPNLFLETLYFGLFWADFTMQSSYARNAYEPTRDDCIKALDLFLDGGLGLDSKKINEINRTLVERGIVYGKDPLESISNFAQALNGLTPHPLQYAGRANLYFSHAHQNTLCRSFIDVSENDAEVKIHCPQCKSLITSAIQKIPTNIRCASCTREYEITGFWGSSEKEGSKHVLYKVPIFRKK